MSRNVIAVKLGNKGVHQEGFVDLDTGNTERTGWESGPSNEFYQAANGAGKGDSRRVDNKEVYDENYKRIFRKPVNKEEDNG